VFEEGTRELRGGVSALRGGVSADALGAFHLILSAKIGYQAREDQGVHCVASAPGSELKSVVRTLFIQSFKLQNWELVAHSYSDRVGLDLDLSTGWTRKIPKRGGIGLLV